MLTESQRYSKECEGKRAYRSKSKANRAQRQHLSVHGGDRLVPYECTWCGGWHLGHRGRVRWLTTQGATA